MSQNYVNILGIELISTSRDRLLTGVRDFISHNKKFVISTPNPELVLASTKNPELRIAVNKSEFSVPDGFGLNLASKILYGKDINIIPGRILFLDLISLANKKGWKVFFLGGGINEAQNASEKLKISYKSINIKTFHGPMLNNNGDPVSEDDKKFEKEAISQINTFAPKLLFVAFGNPKQELWIEKHFKNLDVNCAMSVGGTFRYIAGMSKLPPKWMSKMGIEWLWRLITEPYRIGRIFNAVIVFLLRVFWYKVSGK